MRSPPPTLSRAKFVIVSAAAWGGAVAGLPGCSPSTLPPDPDLPGVYDPFGGRLAFWRYAFRADDFTQIVLGFDNLEPRPFPHEHAVFSQAKRWALVRKHSGPAHIILALPPQHVAEQNFLAASTSTPQHAASRLAGWSRVAFRVPDNRARTWDDGIPFNLERVLAACSEFDLSVPMPQKTASPTMWSIVSDPTLTAIEYPFRLQLSPRDGARFYLRDVAAAPRADERPPTGVAISKRIEAWHARLTTGPSSMSPMPTLFAAYSIFPNVNVGDPENMEQAGGPNCTASVFGMRAQDRTALVKFTGVDPTATSNVQGAIEANRLVLTTAGAETDLRFSRARADGDNGIDLTAWTHRASLGRDDFVELVYPGTLFPYGHKASYIERIQRTANAGQAILLSSSHIRIEEPVKTFSSVPVKENNVDLPSIAQRFAATRIEIVEHETPDIDVFTERLDADALRDCTSALSAILPPNPLAFVPHNRPQFRTGGNPAPAPGKEPQADYRFHLRRTDHDGRTVETRETLIFCSDGIAAVDAAAKGKDIAKKLATAVQAAYVKPALLAADEFADVQRDQHAVIGDLALVVDKVTGDKKIYRCIAPGLAGMLPPASATTDLKTAIWSAFTPQRNFVLLRNQLFAFAPTPDNIRSELQKAAGELTNEALRESATVLATQWIQLQPVVQFVTGAEKAIHAPWAPAAQVKVDALRKILGREVEAAIAFVTTDDALLNAVADAFYVVDSTKNAAKVFARMRERVAIDLQQQERVLEQRARNAIVDLVSDAVGLAAVHGVIHGNFADTIIQAGTSIPKALDKAVAAVPQLDVANLFKDFHSKVLGFIDIGLLIQAGLQPMLQQAAKVPRIVNTLRDGVLVTSYEYTDDLTTETELFKPGPKAKLIFHSDVTVAASGTSTHKLTCSIKDFSISIASGVVTLPFNALDLVQEGQSPPQVHVDMRLPSFAGIFSLLNVSAIQKLFSAFGGGFNIAVSPSDVLAAMSFHIPSINLGAFSISNLNFDLSASLPIVRRPAIVQLGLGSSRNRFMVGVGIFGGGGFLTLGFSLDHAATTLEGAIEFGGYLALNLFVAEGEAHLTAGIGFKIDGAGFEVAGFVRCGGHLSVLNLISVSIEFYLELRSITTSSGTSYRGSCEVRVEVSVLFFSATVTLHFEKSFNADGDRQVAQQLAYHPHILSDVPPGNGMRRIAAIPSSRPFSISATLREEEWREYCDAFAS